MRGRHAISALPVLLAIAQAAAQGPASDQSQNTAASGDWQTYSGSYRSERYSPLNEIAAANVARLHAVWVYQCAPAFSAKVK